MGFHQSMYLRNVSAEPHRLVGLGNGRIRRATAHSRAEVNRGADYGGRPRRRRAAGSTCPVKTYSLRCDEARRAGGEPFHGIDLSFGTGCREKSEEVSLTRALIPVIGIMDTTCGVFSINSINLYK